MSRRVVQLSVWVSSFAGLGCAASTLTQTRAPTKNDGEVVAQENVKSKQPSGQFVVLSDQQAKTIQVVGAAPRDFALQREAVGYIEFNQDQTVALSSSRVGRITKIFVQANDAVAKGRPLFAIVSTDLVQAESILLATSEVLRLTHRQEAAEAALEQAKAQYQSTFDCISKHG